MHANGCSTINIVNFYYTKLWWTMFNMGLFHTKWNVTHWARRCDLNMNHIIFLKFIFFIIQFVSYGILSQFPNYEIFKKVVIFMNFAPLPLGRSHLKTWTSFLKKNYNQQSFCVHYFNIFKWFQTFFEWKIKKERKKLTFCKSHPLCNLKNIYITISL